MTTKRFRREQETGRKLRIARRCPPGFRDL